MRIRALLVVILSLTCFSCQMSQETRQLPNEAFVTFVGESHGAEFQLGESELMGMRGETRYLIDPGPHVVRVFRDGVLIHQEKIYAALGQTVEVRIR